MGGSEGYDTEEEFERELAALGESSVVLGSDSDEDGGQGSSASGGGASDSEEGEDEEEGGGDVLQSLAVYRERLAAEDGKLSRFTASLREIQEAREWQDVQLPTTTTTTTTTTTAAALPTTDASYSLPVPGGEPDETETEGGTLLQPPPSHESPRGFNPSSRQSASQIPTSPSGDGNGGEESAPDERHQMWQEYEAAERRREAERDAERQRAEGEAVRQREEAEAASAAAAAELEAAAQRQLADLEAAAAAEAARWEAEMAAEREAVAAAEAAEAKAAEERRRAEAQAQVEAANREAGREARAAALLQRTGAYASRLVAARRVWAVWRRYRSSEARRRRCAQVIRCQATARRWAARRGAELLRRRAAAVAALEAAREGGDASELAEAAEAAKALGLGEAAAAEVAAFESSCARAASELSRAAQSGDSSEFGSAMAAAAKYGTKLGGLLGEASAAFGARQREAERRVETAVVATSPPVTMVRLQELITDALRIGCDEKRLRASEAKMGARDSAAADDLNAAVLAKPLSREHLTRCLEAVESYGLFPDASAARQRLAYRQAKAATSVQEVADRGSASEFAAATAEATSLGLSDSVEQAEAKFRRRRASATDALSTASAHGSASEFAGALSQATSLGVAADVVERYVATFGSRRRGIACQLLSASTSGTSAEFAAASVAAAPLDLATEVASASAAMDSRRRAAFDALTRAATLALDELGIRPGARGCVSAGWASTSAADVGSAHFGDARLRLPIAAANWTGLMERGEVSAALREAVGAAEGAASALGMHRWWRLSWAVVTAAASVSHAAGRGAVATVDIPADCWGRPAAYMALTPGPEVAALGDPLSALSRTLPCTATPLLLWPQPLNVDALEEAWARWRGSSCPPEGEDAGVEEAQGEERVEEKEEEAMGAEEAEKAVGVQPSRAMLQAACSPGVDLSAVTAMDLSLEGLVGLSGLGDICPHLQTLNAAVNTLSSLVGLENCAPSLQELNLRENRITALNLVTRLTSLRRLNLDANRLTSLAGLAGSGAQLRSLSLAGNQLARLSGHELTAATALESLNLMDNRLTRLRALLAPLTHLTHLDVSGNRLCRLEGLQRCPLLVVLRAGGNRLEAPPDLCHAPMLRELHLNENRLTASPALAWHPHLTTLNLQDNHIPTLSSLSGCPRLRELNVSFNRLTDHHALLATLVGITSLASLQVSDNPCTSGRETTAMLLTRLPWLAELNHDAIDRESARKGALQSLGTAPLAATALLRAQLVANRPMLGAVRGGASVGAVLRGLSAQRATALAVQRHPGELFGWAQAARPSEMIDGGGCKGSWLEEVERGWRHHTVVGLAASQAAEAADWKADGALAVRAHWEQLKLQPVTEHQVVVQSTPEYAERLTAVRARAATVFQSHCRRIKAVRLRARLVAERHDQRLNSSARVIQAAWKGHTYRLSEELRSLREGLAERRRLSAEREAQRRGEAATLVQALGRGWRVRRRMAAAKEAARYVDENDPDDSFDFDEEVDLGFIKPPEGMEIGDTEGPDDTITVDMLDNWAAPSLPAGPLATSVSGSRQRDATPMGDESAAGPGLGYSQEALRKRRESGGALVPTLQRSASGRAMVAVAPPPGDEYHRLTGASEDGEGASPTRSIPESHSNLSYGSSMKDEERRAKLKAKMEKVAGEWGFENSATAEAFYRAQQKRLRSQKQKDNAKRYSDPQKRLQKLKHQMEGKPQLHSSMYQRNQRPAGNTLRPQQGVVEGPQSREGGGRQPQSQSRPPNLPPGGARSADRANRRLAEPAKHGERGLPYPRRAHSFDGDTVEEELGCRDFDGGEEFMKVAHRGGAGTSNSDPGWREFQSASPNHKLPRALGSKEQLESRYSGNSRRPVPAWGHAPPRDRNHEFELDGISGHRIAGVVGSPKGKPRIQAGSPRPIQTMQVLPPVHHA